MRKKRKFHHLIITVATFSSFLSLGAFTAFEDAANLKQLAIEKRKMDTYLEQQRAMISLQQSLLDSSTRLERVSRLAVSVDRQLEKKASHHVPRPRKGERLYIDANGIHVVDLHGNKKRPDVNQGVGGPEGE